MILPPGGYGHGNDVDNDKDDDRYTVGCGDDDGGDADDDCGDKFEGTGKSRTRQEERWQLILPGTQAQRTPGNSMENYSR